MMHFVWDDGQTIVYRSISVCEEDSAKTTTKQIVDEREGILYLIWSLCVRPASLVSLHISLPDTWYLVDLVSEVQ